MMPMMAAMGARSRRNRSGNDPWFANVASLLHFDGANGSTTITDVKGNPWTASGTAALATSPVMIGTACLGGLSGTTAGVRNTTLTAVLSKFTWEGFIYPTSTKAGYAFCLGMDGNNAIFLKAGVLVAYINAGDRILGSSPALNTMSHVAMACDGTNSGLWLNGVSQGIVTGGPSTSTAGFRVGTDAANEGFVGNIDEVRFTNSVARYTPGVSFTPPTGPFPDS